MLYLILLSWAFFYDLFICSNNPTHEIFYGFISHFENIFFLPLWFRIFVHHILTCHSGFIPSWGPQSSLNWYCCCSLLAVSIVKFIILFSAEGDINDVLIKTLAEAHANTNIKLDAVHEMFRKPQVGLAFVWEKFILGFWDASQWVEDTFN